MKWVLSETWRTKSILSSNSKTAPYKESERISLRYSIKEYCLTMKWLVSNKLSWTWRMIFEFAKAKIRRCKTRAASKQLTLRLQNTTIKCSTRSKEKIWSLSRSWESSKRPSREKETQRLRRFRSCTSNFTQMESQLTISTSSTWSCKESWSCWKRILNNSGLTSLHSKGTSRSKKKRLLLSSQKRISLYKRAKMRKQS